MFFLRKSFVFVLPLILSSCAVVSPQPHQAAQDAVDEHQRMHQEAVQQHLEMERQHIIQHHHMQDHHQHNFHMQPF